MNLFVKYYIIIPTFRLKRLVFSQRRKGGLILNNCDLILHFVDKYIAEREKNIILQQKLDLQKQMQNNSKVKTN